MNDQITGLTVENVTSNITNANENENENNENNENENNENTIISSMTNVTATASTTNSSDTNDDNKNEQQCDESKCVSLSTDEYGSNLFSCYAEGDKMDPYSCADGYVGQQIIIIPQEQHQFDSAVDDDNQSSSSQYNNKGDDQKQKYYYTCCPPNYNSTTTTTTTTKVSLLQRHCSDPIALITNNTITALMTNNMTTAVESSSNNNNKAKEFCMNYNNNKNGGTNTNSNLIYPRMMTITEGHPESFMCCDTKISKTHEEQVDSYLLNGTTDNNCIPYNCADIDNDCIYSQYWGSMEVLKCYDYQNTTYLYPQVVASSDEVTSSLGLEYGKTRFECCMETVSMNKYVLACYGRTAWPILVLSVLSLFVSILLIVALILPLIIKQFRKIIKSSGITATAITTTPNNTRNRQRTQQQQRRTTTTTTTNRNSTNVDSANSFNMYLVYLAIPDAVFNMLVTVRVSTILAHDGGVDNWAWLNSIEGKDTNENGYARSIMFSCNSINLYMNAVIVYEVYQLLNSSNQLLRQPPPTLQKAFYQAMVVYILSFVLSLIPSYLPHGLVTAITGYTLSTIIPILYVIYICFQIKRKKLMSTANPHFKVIGKSIFSSLLPIDYYKTLICS
jgi:hypothetical protein